LKIYYWAPYAQLAVKGIFDIDPEPFEIIEREGKHVGNYRIRSLVNPGYVPTRWYKPYELIVIDPQRLAREALSPLTTEYLRTKYGDQIVEQFIQRILGYTYRFMYNYFISNIDLRYWGN
jgi:hypothetical protein